MKIKEFFKGKLFVAFFITYILLTFIIFAFSLTEADSSAKQSSFVSNFFSNTLEFVTKGNVNLSEDGKSKDFPSNINLNGVPKRDLMVGESFFVNYSYPDDKKYAYVNPEFYCDDGSILDVNSKTGEVRVLNVGKTAMKTVIFSTFILFQLFNAFNARELGSVSVLKNLKSNKTMLIVFFITFLFQVVLSEFFGGFFGTVSLPLIVWLKMILLSFSIVLISEIYKYIKRIFNAKKVEKVLIKNKNNA